MTLLSKWAFKYGNRDFPMVALHPKPWGPQFLRALGLTGLIVLLYRRPFTVFRFNLTWLI
jgi:hypothetical protein